MKKFYSLLIAVSFVFNINAQTVSGFNNIVDVNGNTHSLSTYLNDGKYVILNFYLETCGNCMASAPKIQSIYDDYGQNLCEVIVLNLIVDNSSPYPSDQDCIEWMTNAGCTGPPNFNYQASSGSLGWGQFYSVHGGGFGQYYLVSPDDNSVIHSQTGVLDEQALRAVLNNNVTVGASNTGNTSATACDSYTWNGQTYTSSGNYAQSFSNSSGCDSLHTLSLTINSSNSGSGSYTSPTPISWQGQTISSSGSYSATLTNVLGCDSIATLNFTLSTSSTLENDISFGTKKIFKIVDMLGRSNLGDKNKTLFYLYQDGTVEKKLIIE